MVNFLILNSIALKFEINQKSCRLDSFTLQILSSINCAFGEGYSGEKFFLDIMARYLSKAKINNLLI